MDASRNEPSEPARLRLLPDHSRRIEDKPRGNQFLALFVCYHLLAYTQLITSPLGTIWPLGPSSRYISKR